jgi:Rieske Fe-S protein
VKRRKRRADAFTDAVAEGEAIPSGRLDDPEDADALRTAIELKASPPAADLPSEAFVARLRQQLADDGTPAQRRVSRRALVGSAAAVAAGAAIVATVDRTVLDTAAEPATRPRVLDPVDGEWAAVATDADMAGGTPQRFATAEVVGFVTAIGDGVTAVSAACTHLGCILQQNDAARRFDCPCHRTAFSHDGKVVFSQLPTAPPPLTQLQVRRRDGNVEVLLPRST